MLNGWTHYLILYYVQNNLFACRVVIGVAFLTVFENKCIVYRYKLIVCAPSQRIRMIQSGLQLVVEPSHSLWTVCCRLTACFRLVRLVN